MTRFKSLNLSLKDGARDAKVCESNSWELTVYRDLVVFWKLPAIDLKTLENEHFSQGISIKELAKRYQRSPITV